MKRGWVVLFAAACGGSRPTPAPVSNQSAPIERAHVATSCDDAGPLLRRVVSAQSRKEGITEDIIATCKAQNWPVAFLDCLGNAVEDEASRCLEKLPEAQRGELLAKYPADEEEGEKEWAGSDDEGAWTSCGDVLSPEGVARWSPPLKDDKLGVGGALRVKRVEEQCETGWTQEVLACLADAGTQVDPCLAMLRNDEEQALRNAIAEADARRAALAKLAAKPAAITCAKVASAHYTDAKWSKVRPTDPPALRKKELGALRKEMTKTCTAARWSLAMRACIVENDGDECFELGGEAASEWAVSGPLVKPAPTGIAECDEYIEIVWKLGACDKMPAAARTAMKQGLAQATGAWGSLPADAKVAAAQACRAAVDAVKQAMSATGC